MSDLIAKLIETLGPDAVLTGAPGVAVQGAAPACAVVPSSAAELADCVRLAAAANMAVVPWGGGTHQGMGRNLILNSREFIVVSTRKLNTVLQYVPEDMTISVGAGMTLDELKAVIAPNGQALPMDVALPGQATVGGAIAANADGPRRLGYGTFRDCLLGLAMVDAGGQTSKAGGMTVKNVSGYDLMKLHTGALGTLGVITSANFKLYPKPRAAATVTGQFDNLESAFAVVDALHASQLTPSAVELGMGGAITLSVCAEGIAEALERHVRDTVGMMEASKARNLQTLRDEAHDALWHAINDAAQIQALGSDEMVLKLTCLPAELHNLLGQLKELAGVQGLHLGCSARALNGVAYARLRGTYEQLIGMHRALLAKHPRIVVMAAPREVRMQVPIWGNVIAGLDVMQRIKREFDPHNVLNPGRFVV